MVEKRLLLPAGGSVMLTRHTSLSLNTLTAVTFSCSALGFVDSLSWESRLSVEADRLSLLPCRCSVKTRPLCCISTKTSRLDRWHHGRRVEHANTDVYSRKQASRGSVFQMPWGPCWKLKGFHFTRVSDVHLTPRPVDPSNSTILANWSLDWKVACQQLRQAAS